MLSDDDEYADSLGGQSLYEDSQDLGARNSNSNGNSKGKAIEGTRVTNQHFDEAFDVSDGENSMSIDDSRRGKQEGAKKRSDTPPKQELNLNASTKRVAPIHEEEDEDDDDDDFGVQSKSQEAMHAAAMDEARRMAQKVVASSGNQRNQMDQEDSSGDNSPLRRSGNSNNGNSSNAGNWSGNANDHHDGQDDEEEEEEEEEEEGDVKIPGRYDPSDYAHLNVPAEVRELFSKIERFTPGDVELPTKLMPFIPEYIPAVGDLDAMIKVSRPDSREEFLGLVALDEPATKQSNTAALTLQLRSQTKLPGGGSSSSVPSDPSLIVSKVDANSNPKQISEWIASVDKIHKTRAPASFMYTRDMPDIETLMQVWPADVENLLTNIKLPSADLDVSLEEYCRLCLSLVDIPVHGPNVIESLHCLFSLYMEFTASQHFANAPM